MSLLEQYQQGIFNNPSPATTFQPLREVADGSLGASIYSDPGMTQLRGMGDLATTWQSLDKKSLVIGGAAALLVAYLVWGRKKGR